MAEEMSDSRRFDFRNQKWRCTLEFFPDRLEYRWDEWGLGLQHSSRVIVRDQLSPHLTESSSLAGNIKGPLRAVGGYLVLAMFSYALLPLPWRYVTGLFLALFVLSVFWVIRFSRRNRGVNINAKNGLPIVWVNVTKWSDEERREFQQFFGTWLNRPPEKAPPTVGVS
jgi:hypothetical protein